MPIPRFKDGDWVPLVTSPTTSPFAKTEYPLRGIPRSIISIHINLRESFSFPSTNASLPIKLFFSNLVIHPKPHEMGWLVKKNKYPKRQYYIAIGTVSRQPRPTASTLFPPADIMASQILTMLSWSAYTSKPNSPVYPVRAIVAGLPSIFPISKQ